MSKRFKGFAAEDLLTSIFAALLLVVFIFSVVSAYANYFKNIDMAEQSYAALVTAEKIVFDNNGIIADPQEIKTGANNTKITITNKETGQTYTSGSASGYQAVFVSSLPLLIHNLTEGRYYPAILEVYVGK